MAQGGKRKMKTPAGADEKDVGCVTPAVDPERDPAKRICTGGNKDGEQDRRKRMGLRQLEESLMRAQSSRDGFLRKCIVHLNWCLNTLRGNSPFGNGPDGAVYNPEADHSNDQWRKRLEEVIMAVMWLYNDALSGPRLWESSHLNTRPATSTSGNGSDGADGTQDPNHGTHEWQKRLQEAIMAAQSLFNDSLGGFRSDSTSNLSTPPATSPSVTGPDGQHGNPDDTRGKDKLPPQDSHDSEKE
ncbi:kinase domain-containing protein, putative [Babesia ovata]|uniref:Kinase domain-containing protein, putative n=1 Tax=Babesia ovata TaxID=189622 RepID=A0A2H6KH17_9APIC|nr:kinase domain-containing protein, putative [Babesia ovata]GBE62285.1 kinase domain-containing protein, putative [Babesia ovata]